MKIYTITHQENGYDFYLGHVVIANSETEVRKLAIENSADEGGRVWEKAEIIEQGKYTGDETEPIILMSDFNAG